MTLSKGLTEASAVRSGALSSGARAGTLRRALRARLRGAVIKQRCCLCKEASASPSLQPVRAIMQQLQGIPITELHRACYAADQVLNCEKLARGQAVRML